MTGSELYRMYVEQWARFNTEVETWADLSDEDKSVWEGIAAEVRDAYGV